MKLDTLRGRKERVYGPQLPATGFWQRTLPTAIIKTYRRIPDPVRATWSMGSSTSHLALESVAAGGGWSSFRQYSAGWKFLPTYAIGAGIRRAGLAPAVLAAAPVTFGVSTKDGIPGWLDGSTALSNGWSDTPKVPGSQLGRRCPDGTSPARRCTRT
jgi:hypothetical protein